MERGAEEVRRHRGFHALARAGLLARAAVYFVLGALVIEIAVRGSSSSAADSQGAFAAISHQSAGPEVLGLLTLGVAGYAVWRFVEAASPAPQGQQVSGWTRVGWCCAGFVYVFLCVNALEIIFGSQAQGPEQHPSSFAADVLRLPGGAGFMGLLAGAVAVGGLILMGWGVVHDYAESENRAQMSALSLRSLRGTGIAGNVARAIAILIVAGFLFSAAVSEDPMRAKSLDSALQSLAGSGTGALLLGVVGAGFVAFGAFSVLEARFRRV